MQGHKESRGGAGRGPRSGSCRVSNVTLITMLYPGHVQVSRRSPQRPTLSCPARRAARLLRHARGYPRERSRRWRSCELAMPSRTQVYNTRRCQAGGVGGRARDPRTVNHGARWTYHGKTGWKQSVGARGEQDPLVGDPLTLSAGDSPAARRALGAGISNVRSNDVM